MNTEKFLSNSLIIEDENLLLRPFVKTDLDNIEDISYSKELGEYGARVKNGNDLERYYSYCDSHRLSKELYPCVIIKKNGLATKSRTNFLRPMLHF